MHGNRSDDARTQRAVLSLVLDDEINFFVTDVAPSSLSVDRAAG
jgi:hypothetical protein